MPTDMLKKGIKRGMWLSPWSRGTILDKKLQLSRGEVTNNN
jgi:hypothetical protein